MSKKELIELLLKTPNLNGNKPCGSRYCNECSKNKTCKIFKAWEEYEEQNMSKCDTCTDNRFEVIAEYKQKLIEGTNIDTSPKEMEVLDNILFRMWQMGWIPKVDITEIQAEAIEDFAEWLSEVTTFDCGHCQLHHDCYQGKYKGCVKRLLDEYKKERKHE